MPWKWNMCLRNFSWDRREKEDNVYLLITGSSSVKSWKNVHTTFSGKLDILSIVSELNNICGSQFKVVNILVIIGTFLISYYCILFLI